MRPIPQKLKEDLSNDNYYKICARADCNCMGRITWEHSMYYKSRQINEKWAIIPLCERHHLGDLLDKRINEFISLDRLFNNSNWLLEAKKKYPKAIDSWRQKYKYLSNNIK